MRLFIALAVIAPIMGFGHAQAAQLNDESLGSYRSNCVQRCASKHDQASCQQSCDCMAREMRTHWSQERYNRVASTLKTNPKDRRTNRMMQQMAAYCFQRVKGR